MTNQLQKDFEYLTHDIEDLNNKSWLRPSIRFSLTHTFRHSAEDVDKLLDEVFNEQLRKKN